MVIGCIIQMRLLTMKRIPVGVLVMFVWYRLTKALGK